MHMFTSAGWGPSMHSLLCKRALLASTAPPHLRLGFLRVGPGIGSKGQLPAEALAINCCQGLELIHLLLPVV